MTMGDGDDDAQDADDELIPGCYELDVDPNFASDVRAEYIRAYNYIESRYDLCYRRRRAQAIVCTGHPRIGECGCLIFSGHIFDCRVSVFGVYATSVQNGFGFSLQRV